MKKGFFFLLGMAVALSACTDDKNSIIGNWTVDKVHVDFDANHATPEMVKQLGKMQQQNTIVIKSDSTLTFKTMDDEQQGRLSLSPDGTMTLDKAFFGTWKNGEIVTKTDSPLGEIVVSYKKD